MDIREKIFSKVFPYDMETLKLVVLDQIANRLPENAVLLILSLTGSRAFGWAAPNFDYDIHGVYACKNYWDWVHLGEKGIDLSLWNVNHIFMDIEYQHFETFQNLSNPIYLHRDFDFRGMLNLCTAQACDEYSIKFQFERLDAQENPRTALHCYRIVMVMLYWLKYGEFELNVFKINNEYGCEMLEPCYKNYALQEPIDIDYGKIRKELQYLYNEFEKAKQQHKVKQLDKNQFNAWKNEVLKLCQ